MNWEKNFDKHLNKTIKNIDKFEIEEKNKVFLKTSFLLGDTTIRLFIISIMEGGAGVLAQEKGWSKKLKRIPIEGYQELLSMLLYSYLNNIDESKDYSDLFDKKFLVEALFLNRFENITQQQLFVLGILELENNLTNDFVHSTLNHLVGDYFDRLDKALIRILETKKENAE